jgi:hypothetical protein
VVGAAAACALLAVAAARSDAPEGGLHHRNIVCIDPRESIDGTDRWYNYLFNDEIVFMARGRAVPKDKDLPRAPADSGLEEETLKFVWGEGDTLRLHVSLEEAKYLKMKKQAAKKGWYFSGDYTADPPRVILTKEATRYSHWKFVDERYDGDVTTCYLKNENDLHKDAWLLIEKKGTLYKGGIEVRRLVLSPTEKTEFALEDYPSGK